MIGREQWQDPAKPVSGPAPRGVPHTWVIHYPGGPGGVEGTAVPSYLRGIQSHYLASRGYSIGYNWGVAQDGSRWEIRGDLYNNAANAGRKVEGNFNDVSQSIFVMVDEQDAASPKAVASINSIIATHPDWDVIVHSDVDYTSCAGLGLTAQVRAGVIGQGVAPPPEPPQPPRPPVPEEEEEIMIAYIAQPPKNRSGNPPWFVCINGAVRYATNVDATYASDAGWAFVELNDEQYGWMHKQVYGS